MTSGSAVETVDLPSVALRTIVYRPSGIASAANVNECLPARCCWWKSVASGWPSLARSTAVTSAPAVSEYATVALSALPSPSGEIVPGFADGLLNASGTG